MGEKLIFCVPGRCLLRWQTPGSALSLSEQHHRGTGKHWQGRQRAGLWSSQLGYCDL